ncbi:hypothetical protein PVAND_017570 [Polypedilum vanderplanki]|uniref:Conserved oligomeric Golgi complex subunit 5 n=1 Tax=Polypedilum vanderplanki TaxID=319348 RepID=A0A9J6BJE6_POLVA|nr:hypothetical protein PVAND_017570 [Polypedilum vanderplanki]
MVQTSIIDKIENDDFLKNFLHSDSSEHALNNQNLSFPDQIKKLTDGLDLISSELKQKIRHDYPNLIKHSANASKLMVALESLNDDLTNLHLSVETLKKNVYVPYEKLEKQITVSERLYNVSQIMRKVERFLQLHRNLKETNELNKQASLVFELDSLVNDKELCKIEILIDERAAVINTKQRLLHIANRELSNGIQESNEEAITKSLEIYKNLDMLGSFLNNQIESYVNDIKQNIKQCFNGVDLSTLQKTSIKGSPMTNSSKGKLPGRVPNLTTSMNFKAKLLAGLEWFFTDELFTYCEQVITIDKCLKKLTSGLLGENPSKEFLGKFSKTINELLKTSFEESQVHVLQNLQQSLPKLLSYFNTLNEKISREIEFKKDIFSSLNSGYIEKCATNLKIVTNDGGVTEEKIDTMVKNATTELTVSLIDEDLLNSVVNVLVACNSDLISKISSSVKQNNEVEQVISLPSTAQMVNINAGNLIFYHMMKINEMLINLNFEKKEKVAFEKIKKSAEEGRKVTMKILQGLLTQIMSHIRNIFLSMHREPSINSDNINVSVPSLYMNEFQDFLKRSWSSHIAPYNDKVAVTKIASELSTKTIEIFMQNLAILRPISAKGRQRMRSDCGHLETIIQNIVSDSSVLSNSYRTLRSLSSLIVETPEKLVETENNLIPSYIILLMLFGHGGDDLKSPHKAAGWTDEKLINWLAEHKERERLELISGALLKYRNHIREKNKTQYDPVYPLISKMLEECIKPYNHPPARGLL